MEDDFSDLLQCYCSVMSGDLSELSNRSRRLQLPIVPAVRLKSMLNEARDLFSREPLVNRVPTPVNVVGDLHGHILDLLRILKERGLPPVARYVFLGDFIDRGDFSLETLILVLVLKLQFPRDVFCVRGNHEFRTICDHSGFYSEIYSLYCDESIKNVVMDMFEFMPLAANVDDYAICVHGGIGPSWYFLEQLSDLQRPITDFDNALVTEILWSDPAEAVVQYERSERGLGVLYGKAPVTAFLQRTGFTYIVRGHESVNAGCVTSLGHRVVTVFSASSYCGCDTNRSGVLLLLPGESYEVITYDPFSFIRRDECNFEPLDAFKEKASPRRKRAATQRGGSEIKDDSAVPTKACLPPMRCNGPGTLPTSLSMSMRSIPRRVTRAAMSQDRPCAMRKNPASPRIGSTRQRRHTDVGHGLAATSRLPGERQLAKPHFRF